MFSHTRIGFLKSRMKFRRMFMYILLGALVFCFFFPHNARIIILLTGFNIFFPFQLICLNKISFLCRMPILHDIHRLVCAWLLLLQQRMCNVNTHTEFFYGVVFCAIFARLLCHCVFAVNFASTFDD